MIKPLMSLFLFFFLSLAQAADWVTNRDHSEIHFQVPYMGVSELTGRFNEFTGKVHFSEDDKKILGLEVQISASSIDTGNKMRDGHLKSGDFLKSQEHPTIVFKSRQIVSMSKGRFKASGGMTIKGITKPASIEFSTSEVVKDTWGYKNRFVKFKSSLNRKDYQINWNKTLDGQQFLVGDEVSFWGTFQLQPATTTTPNSKHMIPDTKYIRQRDSERINNEKSKDEESVFSEKLRKLINGK